MLVCCAILVQLHLNSKTHSKREMVIESVDAGKCSYYTFIKIVAQNMLGKPFACKFRFTHSLLSLVHKSSGIDLSIHMEVWGITSHAIYTMNMLTNCSKKL